MRFIGLATLLIPSLAQAAPAGTEELLPSGLKMLAALVVVLGIILILYALSRKGVGFLPAAKGGVIQVVEMRSLGAKKGLCLVKVRGEEFLLGIGADRVDFLSRVGSGPSASFEETLRSSLEERS